MRQIGRQVRVASAVLLLLLLLLPSWLALRELQLIRARVAMIIVVLVPSAFQSPFFVSLVWMVQSMVGACADARLCVWVRYRCERSRRWNYRRGMHVDEYRPSMLEDGLMVV